MGEAVKKEGTLSQKEILELGALDTEFFGRTFFPQTIRQPSPKFHKEIDALLEDHRNRFVAVAVFRGGAKTTKIRVFAAKRIAYGLSRTVIFLSRSQAHALTSIEWMIRAVEWNKVYSGFFGLKPGRKWAGDQIEIQHGMGHTVRCVGLGITGQVRGFNFADYRPDLIVCDDIDDEETTHTPEQRLKTGNLLHGAIANSLAPASESPDAMMALLQTPLHREDQVETCLRDDMWASARFGCFDEKKKSRWEERFSTSDLIKLKESYTARNQLGLWMREMECTLIQEETKAFRLAWLNYWKVLPEEMAVYIAIDPAASDAKWADYQAVAAIGVHDNNVFLLEYELAKGQDPEELISSTMRMHRKWHPRVIGVEGGSYQKTLKWYFDRTMQRTGYWMTVVEVKDKRGKAQRIRDTIRDVSFNGRLYVHEEHQEFIGDYTDYEAAGNGGLSHDDLLDAVSMAINLVNPYEAGFAVDVTDGAQRKSVRPRMREWRGAP